MSENAGFTRSLMLCMISKKTLGSAVVLLTCVGALSAKAEEPQYYTWSGDVDGRYSFNKSEYVTREMTLAVDAAYLMPGQELDGEFNFNREYIKLEGSSASLNTDKYDANAKFKQFFDDSPYYAYVSPRTRHNRFAYYQSTVGLRAGGGRKFGGDGPWVINLELGTGYRVAHTLEDERVKEVLETLTVKGSWTINEQVSLKFNAVHEQSQRETYRTVSFGVRNKLTQSIGLKYELIYRQSYPFDATSHDGEIEADVGISYHF
jgi:putative salt-induced outer membrane protein YdiY